MRALATGVTVGAIIAAGAWATGWVEWPGAPVRAPLPLRAAPPAVTAAGSGLIVPVAGVPVTALADSWGDPRGGGTRVHQAIDIMAPEGTAVVAAADGRIEKLHVSGLGGLTAYVRTRDGRWQHYYAHLSRYAPGLREGQRVRQGMVLGAVGSTGNVGPDSPHLHFAIAAMAPGDRWGGGRPINPYPVLAGKAPLR